MQRMLIVRRLPFELLTWWTETWIAPWDDCGSMGSSYEPRCNRTWDLLHIPAELPRCWNRAAQREGSAVGRPSSSARGSSSSSTPRFITWNLESPPRPDQGPGLRRHLQPPGVGICEQLDEVVGSFLGAASGRWPPYPYVVAGTALTQKVRVAVGRPHRERLRGGDGGQCRRAGRETWVSGRKPESSEDGAFWLAFLVGLVAQAGWNW